MTHIIILFFALIGLNGCSGDHSAADNSKVPISKAEQRKKEFGTLMGDDFLLFGGNKKTNKSSTGSLAPSVNPYIWRASLDAISFVPLLSADAVGGVIITDWYSAAKAPTERLKMTIYILDQQLRADAVKVIVFKQIKTKDGHWVAANVESNVATEMENIILAKARQLRISSKESQ